MGLSKAKWVSLVRDWVEGGSAPESIKSRYHPSILETYIGLGFDSLLNLPKDPYLDEMGYDLWRLDTLTKFYTEDILFDSERDRYYVNLPASIQTVNNNSGVRMLFPTREEASAFIPRRQNDVFLMSGLDVNQLSGMIYFNLEGRKLMLSGDINCKWKTVSMKLAVSFGELDDEDEIYLPDGMELKLFEAVRQVIMKNPMDITDDGVSNQNAQ